MKARGGGGKGAATSSAHSAASTPDPAALEALLARVDARARSGRSSGLDARFPARLGALVAARTPAAANKAIAAIAAGHVDRPVDGIVSQSLMELLAIPHAPAPAPVLALLVRMITQTPERFLTGVFDAASAPLDDARRSELRAVAEGLPTLLRLAQHPDAPVRARVAYLLAWLGRRHGAAVVPVLRALGRDGDAAVRGSALIALGLHGAAPDPESADEPDPHVQLCAAVGASFTAGSALSLPHLTALERALADSPIRRWAELPWLDGDLQTLALTRLLAVARDFPERVRARLESMLDGPRAVLAARSLLEIGFGSGPVTRDPSDAQRAILAAIVLHPTAHDAAVAKRIRDAGLDLGTGRELYRQFEHLRRRLALPRTPPLHPPMAKVRLAGQERYAQHVWAEHAEQHPGAPGELADALVEQLSADDLVALLNAAEYNEPDPYSGDEADFEVPLPPGGAPRGRLLVWPGAYEPTARAYLAAVLSQGWQCLAEEWSRTELQFRFAREDRLFWGSLGHDWNAGNPTMHEFELRVSRRWSLRGPLCRRAVERREGEFLAALCAALEHERGPARPGRFPFGYRTLTYALLGWTGTGRPLPPALDHAAVGVQWTWGRPIGLFCTYMKSLPLERAAACVLEVQRGHEPCVEITGLAPTEDVLGAGARAAASYLDRWQSYPHLIDQTLDNWARYLGDSLGALLERTLSEPGLPARAARALRRRLESAR